MAVHLPPGLYSGFTEVLDSTPTANRFAQQQARKQAKMDALDEYDKQRINHINDAGVRDVDRQGFDQRLQKIQLYYNQNKDKIRKGGTPESYEYEKLFRDVGSYVNQSKERTAKQDAAMKFYQEKLKQDGRVPDDFMQDLDTNDKAIDAIVAFDKVNATPIRSQSLDLKKWLNMPKPYNQQASLKAYADIKRTPSVRTEKIPDNPLKLNEITEEKFDDGAKQVIAIRAANDFENSHSFSDVVLADIKDPVTRAKLEQTFKENYQKMPANPEDYATAYRLQELQPKITKTKTIDNKDAIMTRRDKMQREIQDRIDNRTFSIANLRRSWAVADQKAQDEFVDEVYNGYVKAGQVAPEVTKEYEKVDGKGHKVSIEKQVFNPDGTVDFLVMDVDDPTKVDEQFSTRNIPKSQIKAKTRKVFETQTTNTQGQPIRTPKQIDKTKMTVKPTKPKPY